MSIKQQHLLKIGQQFYSEGYFLYSICGKTRSVVLCKNGFKDIVLTFKECEDALTREQPETP